MLAGSANRENAARSSLSKALALLVVIAERGKDGLSMSAAARRAEVNTATAHRLLNALVQENFLSFDPYTKRYHLGLMPYEIVARAGQDLEFLGLRKRLRPALERIQADAGGIVCLSVPSRGESLCIDIVAGQSDITVNTLQVGARRPLGAGAASLALLATMPDEERERIIVSEEDRYRKYGHLAAGIVREACKGLSSEGYVLNDAVIIPDIGALAIPILIEDRVVAAVSVTNTISRLGAARRAEIADIMKHAVRSAGFRSLENS